MLDEVKGFTPAILLEPGHIVSRNKKTGQSDFVATLNNIMNNKNYLQNELGKSVAGFIGGDITNVHDVMVAAKRASISFELMMQIRNQVIEAYREVMRTPA